MAGHAQPLIPDTSWGLRQLMLYLPWFWLAHELGDLRSHLEDASALGRRRMPAGSIVGGRVGLGLGGQTLQQRPGGICCAKEQS